MVHENQARGLQSFLRVYTAIRPDIENEFLVVGALTDTGVLDQEIHACYRRKDRVDGYTANLLIWLLVSIGKAESATSANLAFHFDFAIDIESANLLCGIENLDGIGFGEISGGHNARSLGLQRNNLRFAICWLEKNSLQVEDDVGDIFRTAANSRKLMAHTRDFHG